MDFRKGTVYLIFAWGVILVTGYALTLYLARHLTLDAYGDYGLVMSILLWLEILVINGIPYAVQKFAASNIGRAYSVLWSGVLIQIVAAVVLYALSFFLAPVLARVFQDSRLTLYFRIAFLNIVLYGFFYLLASFQNGLGRFGRQALLLVVFAFGKMGFVILFVFYGHSLIWAFWGNVAGAALGMMVGCFFIREKWKSPIYDPKALVRFAAPSVLYSLAVTLLLSVDLWFVNRLLGKEAGAVYVASSMVARIPYFLVFGLSSTMLPTVAAAIAAQNMKKVQSTIEQAIRFLFMLSAAIVILATLYRLEIMSLLFPVRFVSGNTVIGILIWGMTFLAFFVVFTTVINADNRPSVSFFITMIVVVLDGILNYFLVPKMGIYGGAIATTLAIGTGVLISAIEVWRVFRFRLHPKSFLRIGLASMIPVVFGLWVPARGIGLILVGAIAITLYGLVLLATGEIRKEELLVFFRSKGKPPQTRVESIIP